MSISPQRWQQIKVVLYNALEQPPQQRPEFLAKACSGDQALRREVESFLALGRWRGTHKLSSILRYAHHVTARNEAWRIRSAIPSGCRWNGEVYRARDSRLKRDVAVKVLPRFVSTDPGRLRRFEQEAQAAASLNHPNILAVYQMGTYEGAPYIVSELLEGETLWPRYNNSCNRDINRELNSRIRKRSISVRPSTLNQGRDFLLDRETEEGRLIRWEANTIRREY